MGESGFSFGGGGFAGGSFVAGFSEGAGLEGVDPGSFNKLILDALPTPGTFERLPAYYAEVVSNSIRRLRAGEISEGMFGLVVGRYAQTLGESPSSLVTRALALLPPDPATAMGSAVGSASISDTGSTAMGFLDSVGGFLGSVGDFAQSGLNQIADFIAPGLDAVEGALQNPSIQQAVALAQQLGVIDVGVGGGGTPPIFVPPPGQTNTTGSQPMNTPMNPDTGSPMMTGGSVATAGLNPTALLAALRRALGTPAGQIATGVGTGLAVDQSLQALLSGAGAGGPLMQFGEPPRNPLTGRRLSTLTFLDSQTGRPVVYKSQGTCLLSTGDVSSAKRVQRVARRAARGRRRSPARAPVSVQLSAPRNHVVCGSCLTSPCGCK